MAPDGDEARRPLDIRLAASRQHEEQGSERSDGTGGSSRCFSSSSRQLGRAAATTARLAASAVAAAVARGAARRTARVARPAAGAAARGTTARVARHLYAFCSPKEKTVANEILRSRRD